MPTYIVESAAKKADKPDKGYGPKMIVALALKDEDGKVHHAEWYTNASTPIPNPGAQLMGDISPGKFGGLDFKKQSLGSGGGGKYKQTHPVDAARMARCHSQEMALRYAEIQASRGELPDEWKVTDLTAIIDWFERDIANNAQPYAQGTVKEPVKTGQTDVPADLDAFRHPPVAEDDLAPFTGAPS